MDRSAEGARFFAYATNYLIDMDHAVIVDVEASRAIRQAEVGAARTMIERTQDRFGLWPQRLAADSAYGSAENLAWLVHERGIEPHIPVFDNSERKDGQGGRSRGVSNASGSDPHLMNLGIGKTTTPHVMQRTGRTDRLRVQLVVCCDRPGCVP